MRAINHALTGALIGFVVAEPLVAVPAAILSHYVCDVIPHYDDNRLSKPAWVASAKFRNLLIVDALLCVTLVGLLAYQHPLHWLLAAVCAFAAAAPDMLSFSMYRDSQRKHRFKLSVYQRFAMAIQWFERPIGAVVEVTWLVAASLLLLPFLR